MRQAPDVIFVGEIRDHDTAFTALQACETGHLVLASMHSANVADTMERFVNMFPAGAGGHRPAPALAPAHRRPVPEAGAGRAREGSSCWPSICRTAERCVTGSRNGSRVRHRGLHEPRQRSQHAAPSCSPSWPPSEAGVIDEAEAVAAAGSEAEFRRAARGIS
jgi:hypothetical protein